MVMRLGKSIPSVLIVLIMLSSIAGCAGGGLGGRVVPVEPGDMAKLVGTWQGTMIFPSGASWPATLLVYPNGTYATEAGAFTSRGKAQLKNGKLDFITSYTSGGLAVDNRTGSASLVDQGSSWGLVGSGWADAGLYNFDFSKPK
jgi:hypothetical protein